ncbi:MAG: sulfatase-like hydrolase/transferase [Lentisphaerales bacterium]|nr:sulfatase-like hydrolase/transferase [Lentisphaerales bacterium]
MRFIICFLFLLICLSADDKPNILFVFTDDQSHRTVSCYEEAYDWVNTPNIDSLAKNGIRFSSAYIGTWCMASRLTMLTGLLQHGQNSVKMVGKYPGSTYDPEVLPFWPATFRQNGYQTAHIGKWHTGNDGGYGRDWDHQIIWNRPKYNRNSGAYYYNQDTEVNGQHIGKVEGYSTDNYSKWAEEYIRSRQGTKPWALWLCYAGVHGPFTPANRHKSQYEGVKVPSPLDIYGPRDGKPSHVKNRSDFTPDKNGEPELIKKDKDSGKGLHGNTLSDFVRQYNQAVTSIDEGIGEILKALKETGQYDNTLIIFTSDQGQAWGQHGYKYKFAPYASTIKSPMIISYPKRFPSGKVCNAHISGADIVPTFFDICGIDLPWRMDGRSIRPLLEKPDMSWDHPVLMTYTKHSYGEDTIQIPEDEDLFIHKTGVPWWSFLLQGRYKYIHTLVDGEIPELYDLKNDPQELHNLALNPEYRTIVKKYKEIMIKELRRTKAGFVENLPKLKF